MDKDNRGGLEVLDQVSSHRDQRKYAYASRVTLSNCSRHFLANYVELIVSCCALSLLGNNLEEKDVDGSKDNRAIVDNNTAQSLTSEDIDEMRR